VNKSLLDTDILSEILKGINPNVASNAAAYRQTFGRYSLSSVTVMEVISGLQRIQSIRRIQKFLTDISGEDVLPFGQAEGQLAGAIDGDLERVGRPIGRCDRGSDSRVAGKHCCFPAPSERHMTVARHAAQAFTKGSGNHWNRNTR
jgi:tRNA(fMet)-specific endonuclease VapC